MDQVEELKVKIYCCMYDGCYKEYKTKYNLIRHINVNHLKKKIGKCSICNKEFVDYDNLKEHLTIHSNTKPYSCTLCGKNYRNKCMMIRHKRDHEFKEKESNFVFEL
ncbi:hypothetical protein SteCoe_19200 [Stentor coeruleus]|uniref:C2H2-type domain-containing protein n=1 Tax=Stentor coeruleus TaxID=5963 RepID=A0A1R2BUS3_9CILI|nr:hypothetical protein SteCoe_19200 [Stentor coeruleus]